MSNVFSMIGANDATEVNWVWCVPGKASPNFTRIIVLVMCTDGPRYVPTSVVPANRFGAHPGEFIELRPTAEDVILAESVHSWILRKEAANVSVAALCASADAANNVAAARRFLDPTGEAQVMDRVPIDDDNRYLGRSVLVKPASSRIARTGWIVSSEGPFDVVFRNANGVFEKILSGSDTLYEDGSTQLARAVRSAKILRP